MQRRKHPGEASRQLVTLIIKILYQFLHSYKSKWKKTSLQHGNIEWVAIANIPLGVFLPLFLGNFCKLVSLTDTGRIKGNRGIKGRKLENGCKPVGWLLLTISAHFGKGGGQEDPRSWWLFLIRLAKYCHQPISGRGSRCTQG